jgi:hypothetical protein
MLPKPNANTPNATDTTRTTQTRTQATEVLQLTDPPQLEDIPALCHRAITTIINKASRKLANSLRKKEDQLYKKSPKRYHNNLKTAAGLQPNAKDQPKLEAIRDPTNNNIVTSPPQVINILQAHFEKEHSRTTPDQIPTPPWQNPLNPDPYTNPKPNTPTQQHTLDYYLTKNHYTIACHKASVGKAPGPDAIPNEILKHLPESAHELIYLLFRLMAKYSYTPKNGAQALQNSSTNPTKQTRITPQTIDPSL